MRPGRPGLGAARPRRPTTFRPRRAPGHGPVSVRFAPRRSSPVRTRAPTKTGLASEPLRRASPYEDLFLAVARLAVEDVFFLAVGFILALVFFLAVAPFPSSSAISFLGAIAR